LCHRLQINRNQLDPTVGTQKTLTVELLHRSPPVLELSILEAIMIGIPYHNALPLIFAHPVSSLPLHPQSSGGSLSNPPLGHTTQKYSAILAARPGTASPGSSSARSACMI
jgi:hypothetical protein